ncbi:MAG: hypothetical protein KGJ32_06560 [Xanthomonadaceae bacterium]|nr:hypothetical protein [Xanthomonadaceae bacterium]
MSDAIVVGDRLVCHNCNNAIDVTEEYIGLISTRYFPWRSAPALFAEDLSKFRCTQCKGSQIEVAKEPLSAPAPAEIKAMEYITCRRCGGEGPGGCPRCGGNGIDPDGPYYHYVLADMAGEDAFGEGYD